MSEKFQWIELGEDKVALKLKNGPFLSLADSGLIVANGQSAGTKETYKVTHPTNTTIALIASNGKYVTVDANGFLRATATSVSSSSSFQLLDEGALGEWNVLVTYKDQMSLTGFTVSQTYRTDLGLFYSEEKEETIRANLLMSNLFLRNSTNHLSEMPTVLANYNSNVENALGVFGTSDEALVEMSNTILPEALDSLPENMTLPVILAVEESSRIAEMNQYTSGAYISGNSFTINLTATPMMTTKTLKMNFYETKENAALSLEDTLRKHPKLGTKR